MEGKLKGHIEKLRMSRDNLIYLPFEDDAYPNIPMLFMREFDNSLFVNNHRLMMLVGEFTRTVGLKAYRAYKRGTFPISSLQADQALQIVDRLKTSPNSDEMIENLIGQRSPRKLHLNEELSEEIWEGLRRSSGKSCVLSPSHVTDFHMIDVLKTAGVRLNEVGLIVIDQHVDGNINPTSDGQFVLDKANFLIHALDIGLGAVSIMGLNEKDVSQIKGEVDLLGRTPGQKVVQLPDELVEFTSGITDLQQFYGRYEGRVGLAQGIFNESRNMISPKKVFAAIKKQVKFLKERGIKQVLVSFDLDSLNMMREMITATQYSPFNSIVLMGIQDLNQALGAAGLTEGVFEGKIRKLQKIGREIEAIERLRGRKGNLPPHESDLLEDKKERFEVLVQDIYPVAFNIEKALHFLTCPVNSKSVGSFIMRSLKEAHIINSDEGGLTLDQAEYVVSSIKTLVEEAGMENGIPVFNGRIMGSVSELDGIDVDGNSTQAAIRMVNAVTA